MAFTVPDSSSPPSTPDPNSRSRTGPFGSNPSTTPAGPPPSSVASFTPAGPPPSSIFGSSQLHSGNTLFSNRSNAGAFGQPSFGNHQTSSASLFSTQNVGRSPFGGFVQSTDTSLPNVEEAGSEEEEYEEEGEEDVEYEEDGEGEDGMEVDADFEEDAQFSTSTGPRGSQSATNPRPITNPSPRTTYNALRSSTRAKANKPRGRLGNLPRKAKDSAVSEIARSLAERRQNGTIDEPDRLVLVTENTVATLYTELETSKARNNRRSKESLSASTVQLIDTWTYFAEIPEDWRVLGTIGPGEDASPITKATWLSALLLSLHHPFEVELKSNLGASVSRSSHLGNQASGTRLATIPEVILDWLDGSHDALGDIPENLSKFRPNPTSHSSYWDIIFTCAIRGHLDDVLRIFEASDFQYARSAKDDGETNNGYRGHQLQVISGFIKRAQYVLKSCPGVKSSNWDVKGREWAVFRRQVETALDELMIFAEGAEDDPDEPPTGFHAENFGIAKSRYDPRSISQSARRASSRVPWTIYQSLKDLYSIMLGSSSEIVGYAQDWAEATMSLALWWDGDDDGEIVLGESLSRIRSYKQNPSQEPRLVDINPEAAYIKRLSYAFDRVTEGSEETSFQIDSMNPVEVGLAAIFENDVEAVLGLLQSWSLPIAAAVAEIATLGGWLAASTGTDLMGEFNDSDLIVLGSQKNEKKITKDSILEIYSTGLFLKGTLAVEGMEREGWELAFEILPRLSDRAKMEFKVNDFLKQFPLESQLMADKLMIALEGLGLDQAAQQVSEMFSDHVAETSQSYGTALIGYARAHNPKKMKNVLDLLISYCLVQSTAYPPMEDLDEHLRDLLVQPKVTLKNIFENDPQGGEMLRFYLSGYATLRKFYDLRDEEVSADSGQKVQHQPLVRTRLAIKNLLMVIKSAADSIHGGLYDESRESVVQVDGLMALLGEALHFVNQPNRALSDDQIFALLTAIEDLETVTSRVYEQCEECFQSAIRNARGTEPPSLQDMFKKTQSNLSASAFSFSMIGSQMISEPGPPNNRSNSTGGSSSGILVPGKGNVKKKRGWDWRIALPEDVKGKEILRRLRVALAKQLAMGWSE